MRIHVDIWFSEAELHASGAVDRAIGKARAAGHVYEHDGATWLATSQFGDDKDRVLIKSDGAPAYFAADLAYIEHKFGRGHDRLIYILGADHHGYVARLKAAAACMGYDPDAVEVPIYQMVTVSGERMGKRRGNVVTADELMDAIGVDASAVLPRPALARPDAWTSTSTWPSGRSARTRSTTCSTRTPARSRSCAARREEGDGPTAGPWAHAPEPQERDAREAAGRVAGRRRATPPSAARRTA